MALKWIQFYEKYIKYSNYQYHTIIETVFQLEELWLYDLVDENKIKTIATCIERMYNVISNHF